MTIELSAFQHQFFKFPPVIQEGISLIKENLENLLADFQSFDLPSIEKTLKVEIEAFRESLMSVESFFYAQRNRSYDHIDLTDLTGSTEYKTGLKDKLFNMLHGIIGNMARLREVLLHLKALLHAQLDLRHSQKLVVVTNGLENNIQQLEKYLNSQENIMNHVIENPKDSPMLTSSSFWHTKAPVLSNTKKKVLIVDDAEINRKILGGFLKEYDCYYAVDGLDALIKYDEIKPDIILMDIVMPRMTGIEAAAEIRARETQKRVPRIPIIAVTATPSDEIFNSMDTCLAKPFKKDSIIQIIERVTNNLKACSMLSVRSHF